MKSVYYFSVLLVLTALGGLGCQGGKPQGAVSKTNSAADEEAEIHTNLGKLNAEDRRLAEAQKSCAVEDDNRLGSMGVPLKVMIKDQPVFLCCKGCQKTALANPDQTLAKVEELKNKSKDPAPGK